MLGKNMNAVHGQNGITAIYLGNNLIGTIQNPTPGENIAHTKWVIPEAYDNEYTSSSLTNNETALLNLKAYTDLIEI